MSTDLLSLSSTVNKIDDFIVSLKDLKHFRATMTTVMDKDCTHPKY